MEYCCHVYSGARRSYKSGCIRTVGTSLDASLKPLAHCRNSSEMAELVPLPYP